MSATYAVFGNPIEHSKSPIIHTAFAQQFSEKIIYRAKSIEPDEFEASVRDFFKEGGAGLNITVPFKERAFAMADDVSDRAARAKAANCLIPIEDGRLRADNTDGVGLIRDMVINHHWQLDGRKTLVLGAGGAVRGILQPLLQNRPDSVIIANRTVVKAETLAAEFSELDVNLRGVDFESLEGETFDLVINGISAGLSGDMPDLPEFILSDRCCCYDMVYGAEPTPFMRWSVDKEPWAVVDGLGMLVEQAAESFHLWRGCRPATKEVVQNLRQTMLSI